MGITQSSGIDHNLYWNLGNKLGNPFEDIISNMIIKALGDQLYKDVTVEQTARVNDHGKDIVVKFTCETLSLFGVSFSKGEKKEATIYIECKSSNSNHALREEKFISSIKKGCSNVIDYYVLLTNSKIQPTHYYEAEELLNQKGISFVLIDQYLLAKFLRQNSCKSFPDLPLYDGNDEYYIQYQVDENNIDKETYDIYFVFRNYSCIPQLYTISLVTDRYWNTKENTFSFTVDANCAHSRKISLTCDFENNYKTLVFKIESGQSESFVNIEGLNIEERYIPPLTGKYHNKILFHMYNSIISNNPSFLYCLWGEAGIGKSRIASELRDKLKGGHFDIYECVLGRKNDVALKGISEFLRKKGYISKDIQQKYNIDLYHTVVSCKTEFKTAVIFIDDFHNSGSELIEQIKQLEIISTPVILVLCGRTDYSAGSIPYYAFVQWTFEFLKGKHNIWNVKPLQPCETHSLVQAMIKRLPQDALNIICKLSDNNPLYIVQFVEYLLDNKMAYIINRNSVGIVDPSEFQSHVYLPNGIADIYCKRINHLNKESGKYLRFLFALYIYGGQMSMYFAERYLDIDNTTISFLCNKKFLSRKRKMIAFYHESIMIYIQNLIDQSNSHKSKIANFILQLQEPAKADLSIYTIGRLYLWSGNTQKATEIFKPIIRQILAIRNISNLNIDISSYSYFDDILQICQQTQENNKLAEQTIKASVYIKLHYFVPINAAAECNKHILYIAKSPMLKENYQLIHSLQIQKAHALLNAGKNMEGELVLKELQAKWLILRDQFDPNAVFDMLDRLCAIYIKFNCYDMAHDYSKLALDTAERTGDQSLIIIAYRTRSKLFYLSNLSECRMSLDKVDSLLQETPSPRIQLNNDIYRAIVDLTYYAENNYDEIVSRLEQLSQEADDRNMNRADIQSNMALAAAYLKRGGSEDLISARESAVKAINRSIRYGIPSYMWQLYNLLAIIDTKLKKTTNEIKQSFENCFDILEKQDLLFIGRSNLCYSNILAISNMAFYLCKYTFQKTFNARMSRITYCADTSAGTANHEIANNVHLSEFELTQIYEKALKKELIFSSGELSRSLKDDETGYFIALT